MIRALVRSLRNWWFTLGVPSVTDRQIQQLAHQGQWLIHYEAASIVRLMGGEE